MKNLHTSQSEVNSVLLNNIQQTKGKIILSEEVINEEPRRNSVAEPSGTSTYDLRNVHYINNTGLAHMIELKRTALKNGIQIYFVNVCDNVRSKIQAMGIIHLFNC